MLATSVIASLSKIMWVFQQSSQSSVSWMKWWRFTLNFRWRNRQHRTQHYLSPPSDSSQGCKRQCSCIPQPTLHCERQRSHSYRNRNWGKNLVSKKTLKADNILIWHSEIIHASVCKIPKRYSYFENMTAYYRLGVEDILWKTFGSLSHCKK